jgi:hypothetical protein
MNLKKILTHLIESGFQQKTKFYFTICPLKRSFEMIKMTI